MTRSSRSSFMSPLMATTMRAPHRNATLPENPQVAWAIRCLELARIHYEDHGMWPARTDIILGKWTVMVNSQIMRLRRGNSPTFGSQGLTESLWSDIRKSKYEPARPNNQTVQSGVLRAIEAVLENGDALSPEQEADLAKMFKRKKLTPTALARLAKLGRLPPP